MLDKCERNSNAVTIIWNKVYKDSLVISNDYGFPIRLNFNSYKVRYYSFQDRLEFQNKYRPDGRIRSEYLTIDIKEGLAVVNGKKLD